MPTWLVHGFRWPRVAIRIHVILENLEDCAPDWLMAPATVAQLTRNFRKQYPDQLYHLPSLRFIEQYDPEDEVTKEQPYAYVCDQVHEVKLGVEVDEVRGQGVKSEAWTALVELRDKVAPGEKVGWFVVVNGDVERWAPPLSEDGDGDDENIETDMGKNDVAQRPASSPSHHSSVGRSESEDAGPQKKGLKNWFAKIRRAKSIKDLRSGSPRRGAPSSPPMPNIPHPPANTKMTNGKAPPTAGTA